MNRLASSGISMPRCSRHGIPRYY